MNWASITVVAALLIACLAVAFVLGVELALYLGDRFLFRASPQANEGVSSEHARFIPAPPPFPPLPRVHLV